MSEAALRKRPKRREAIDSVPMSEPKATKR